MSAAVFVMSDLINYATALAELNHKSLPPVDQWSPEKVGEIDIVIKHDGTWFHEGQPMKRARLVRAFSTLLVKEAEAYFLKTPYEKLRIHVEDVPLIAVSLTRSIRDGVQVLSFKTNLGDEVEASADQPIRYEAMEKYEGAVPYILVRNGIEARIGTSVYYEMVEYAEERITAERREVGLYSCGDFFKLGDMNENY